MFARRRADGRQRARDETECRRDERERPSEIQIRPGGGRHDRNDDRQCDGRGDGGVDEVQHVVVEDTRSFERRAERAFDKRSDRGADDDRDNRRRRDETKRDAQRGERQRRDDSGRRAFERHRARSAWCHSAETVDEEGCSPPRLADLTRNRVASARCQRGDEREQGVRAIRREDRERSGDGGHTAVRERVARAAPPATFLGDARAGSCA